MEALAVVGAVAALVQLSEAGGWFARGLFRFAKHAGAAGVEVQRFGHQVRSSANSIEFALITLNRYCARHPRSAVAVYMSMNDVLTNVNTEAELVLDHIDAIVDQVYSMRSRSVFWTNMKWSFKKVSILELCPEIERVKTSLTLLMIAVQIEASASSSPAPGAGGPPPGAGGPPPGAGGPAPGDAGLKNEIHLLRRAMKHHLQTMARLSQQISHGRYLNNTQRATSIAHHEQEALMDLGWSMWEQGTVPGSSPSSRPNWPDGSRATNSKVASTSFTTLASASSSPPLDGPSSVPILTGQNNSPVAPTPPRPFSRSLCLNASYFTETIPGYVTTSSGSLMPTKAVVVRGLDGNVISVLEARRLGVHIETLGPTEGVVLDFGNRSPARSVGKVTLQWSRSRDDDAQHPPLTVRCDVCDDFQPGLIFGKPFLQEKSRRWASGGGVVGVQTYS